MKKIMHFLFGISISIILWAGCSVSSQTLLNKDSMFLPVRDFTFTVNPETFALTIHSDGTDVAAAFAGNSIPVSDIVRAEHTVSWKYPEKNISVRLKKKDGYLDVSITDTGRGESRFEWPAVQAEQYTLPLYEGRYIPADDQGWKTFLDGTVYNGIESLSMQFFALNMKDLAVLYIIKNPFNNLISFTADEKLAFSFTHEFPSINKNREYGFRIYITENDPAAIAKIYRAYVIETGNFKTLEEKAADNPNIRKLYGAPHVYFWDRSVISEENINWNLLRTSISPEMKKHFQTLLSRIEDGNDLAAAFNELTELDYTAKYTKTRILRCFTELAQMKGLYASSLFPLPDETAGMFLTKGIGNLNDAELVLLNKHLLKSALDAATDPVAKWAEASTIDIIDDMYKSGIDRLWIGVDDWTEAYLNPAFVANAADLGYLIGPYDSYHSIHRNGQEKWSTAAFSDTSLFENATVTLRSGKKAEGFQGVGRKLNPVLSLPSVKERTGKILANGIPFNSWFIDCDATGEIYDDYSPEHITIQSDDLNARLERMAWIRNEKNMVIGSEGGNDFAVSVIAFAHGIETPAFSWMDSDMNKNRQSEYYLGRYYSPTGGVPEIFSKQVPVKERFRHIFFDPAYILPLYKLVYNDSVITTHQWLWGSLKVRDEQKSRMLTEVLYNVPPLYHLDRQEWKKHKDTILAHTSIWSEFSKKAIMREMTDFKILSPDRLLQTAVFGDDLSVIANFSDISVSVSGGSVIPPLSLIIRSGDKDTVYTPSVY